MSNPIYHSQYTAAQIEAALGKGPRVNSSGFWEVWNIATGAYESTGVGAGVKAPTVVSQASQMTNHGYIYIYNGSETGYTAGYWYYWDGSAWTAGGAYQVAATDPTLSVSGAAADAKATGEVKSLVEETIAQTDNVIKYWGPNKTLSIVTSSSAKRVGVSSNGTLITLTGRTATATGGSMNQVRIRISGDIDRASTIAQTAAWSRDITLLAGHVYAFTCRIVGGSYSVLSGGTDSISLEFRKDDSSSTRVFDFVSYRSNQTAFITPTENTNVVMIVYLGGGLDFSNLVLYTDCRDITKTLSENNIYSYMQDNPKTDTTMTSTALPAQSRAAGDYGMVGKRTAKYAFNGKIAYSTYRNAPVLNPGGISQTTGARLGSDYDNIRCFSRFTSNFDKGFPCLVSLNDPDYEIGITCYNHSVSSDNFTHSATDGHFVSGNSDIVVEPLGVANLYAICFRRADNGVLTTDLTDPTSDYSIILSKLRVSFLPPEYHATPANNLLMIPQYELAGRFDADETIYLGTYTDENDTNYRLTQGIASDGVRYLYFALCTGGVRDEDGILTNVDKPRMVKYDVWRNCRELIDANPEINYGHTESITYVPADVPGFDNGTVNRLYVTANNRAPEYDGSGNVIYVDGYPVRERGFVVNVLSADDLSYITSFTTSDLVSTEDVPNWTGISRCVYSPARNLFCVHTKRTENDTDYHALCIFDGSGNLLKAAQYTQFGTQVGFDCDDNYIYYCRYITGAKHVCILDWDLNRYTKVSINDYQWEWEGMCHIGQDVYTTWNQEVSGRTGCEIVKGKIGTKKFLPINTEFPLDDFNVFTGWEFVYSSSSPTASAVEAEIEYIENGVTVKAAYDPTTASWATGYYGTGSGTYHSSTQYIRSSSYIEPKCNKLVVTAPEGYAVSVCEYQADGTFVAGYGNPNSTAVSRADSVSILCNDTTHKFRINVGKFATGTASQYVNDEFVSTISIEVYKFKDDVLDDRVTALESESGLLFTNVGMLDKIGICGASWDTGYYYTNTGRNYTNRAHSWGATLAKMYGIEYGNYSVPSGVTKAPNSSYSAGVCWQTNEHGLPALLNDTPCDLYWFRLLGNDKTKLGTGYLGTIADIHDSDYTQNPDTFYGNYGRIIEQVKAHAPNALIILSYTMGDTPTEDLTAFVNALLAIAEHYGLPTINWHDNAAFASIYSQTLIHDHPTLAANAGMAYAAEWLFAECVKNNQDYFDAFHV